MPDVPLIQLFSMIFPCSLFHVAEAPYSVRLVNGTSPSEGRVEVLYKGQWNTICDDFWNLEEAQVVCRQLGYGTDFVVARGSAYYGEGSGPIRQAQCSGLESNLGSCSLTSGDSECSHSEDAGVNCGKLILPFPMTSNYYTQQKKTMALYYFLNFSIKPSKRYNKICN